MLWCILNFNLQVVFFFFCFENDAVNGEETEMIFFLSISSAVGLTNKIERT